MPRQSRPLRETGGEPRWEREPRRRTGATQGEREPRREKRRGSVATHLNRCSSTHLTHMIRVRVESMKKI